MRSQLAAAEGARETSDAMLTGLSERVKQLEAALAEARAQTKEAETKLVDAEEHYSRQVGGGWSGSFSTGIIIYAFSAPDLPLICRVTWMNKTDAQHAFAP